VTTHGKSLCLLPKSLQNDRKIVLAAVQNNGMALKHASPALQNDEEVVKRAIDNNGLALVFASTTLQANKNVVLASISSQLESTDTISLGQIMNHMASDLWADREIALQCVRADGDMLYKFSKTLKDDRDIVLAAVNKGGFALRYASEKLQGDREIVESAVRSSGKALKFASPIFYSDSKIALAAVTTHGKSLCLLPKSLQNDRKIVLAAVQNNGMALKHASPALQNDEEVVKRAIDNNGLALVFASTTLQANKNVVLASISSQLESTDTISLGQIMNHMASDLWADREIALQCVRADGDMLYKFSKTLKDDRDIVLAAVNNKGFALRHASEKLRSDREVVMEAVKNCDRGRILKYVSKELKADREIVLCAVSNRKIAYQSFQFMDPAMRSEKEIALRAVQSDNKIIHSVDIALRDDPNIIAAVVGQLFIYDQDQDARSNFSNIVGPNLQQRIRQMNNLLCQEEDLPDLTALTCNSDAPDMETDARKQRDFADFAEISWRSRSYETIWLLGNIIDRASIDMSITRYIVEYTGLSQKICQAKELSQLSYMYWKFAEAGWTWNKIPVETLFDSSDSGFTSGFTSEIGLFDDSSDEEL